MKHAIPISATTGGTHRLVKPSTTEGRIPNPIPVVVEVISEGGMIVLSRRTRFTHYRETTRGRLLMAPPVVFAPIPRGIVVSKVWLRTSIGTFSAGGSSFVLEGRELRLDPVQIEVPR